MKTGFASSITADLFKRQHDNIEYNFPRKYHVSSDFIQRLGLEKELEGHNGCVNCLEWNTTGDILASGSDDFHVAIWNPLSHQKISMFKTSHQGNIFSIKFLPSSNDAILVTGAADNCVSLQDIERGQTLTTYKCHLGRVKRLATTRAEPYMIWSVGEDGVVMQYDTREAIHQHGASCPHVLINLNTFMGPTAEGKCLNLNPVRPELMAVGANDPYVRLYDRRMLTLRTVKYPDNWSSYSIWDKQNLFALLGTQNPSQFDIPLKASRYFISGHIPFRVGEYRKRYRTLACTYVTFSPDGSELLANLGGEQIYLFDVSSRSVYSRDDRSYAQILTLRPPHPEAHSPSQKPKLSFNSRNEDGLCDKVNLTNKKRKTENGFLPHPNIDCPEVSKTSPKAKALTNGRKGTEGEKRYEALVRDLFELTVTNTPPFDTADRPEHPSMGVGVGGQILTPLAELLKSRANQIFEQNKYTEAIALYNKAIALSPKSALLLGNRAAALMKRHWDGDVYAAMRDCLRALELDPGHLKARFRMIRCLLHLDKVAEATACLERFKQKFPEYAASGACKSLESEIAYKEFHDKQGPDSPKNDSATFESTSLRPMSQTLVDFLRDTDPIDELFLNVPSGENTIPTAQSEPFLEQNSSETRVPMARRLHWELSAGLGAADDDLEADNHDGNVSYTTLNFSDNSSLSFNTYAERPSDPAALNSKFRIPTKERVWKGGSPDYSRRFCGHCNTTTDIKEANFFGSDGQYIVAGSDDGYFFVWDRATTNICRVLLADDSIVNCLQPHPSTCLLATSGIDPVIRLWSPRPENNKEEREIADSNDAAAANQKRMNADPIEVMLMNMGYRVNNPTTTTTSSTNAPESSDTTQASRHGISPRAGLFRGPDISSTTVHCRTN